MTVLTHPDPRLSQKCDEVNIECAVEMVEVAQLIEDLVVTMRKESGAGLAAAQVGVSKRVFVYDISDGEGSPDSLDDLSGKSKDGNAAALINPIITFLSEEVIEDEEGCLSFPALYAPVKRSQKVVVSGYNQAGEAVTVEAEDFLARVFQHEIDHLDGVTFVTRLPEEGKMHALREYFDLHSG